MRVVIMVCLFALAACRGDERPSDPADHHFGHADHGKTHRVEVGDTAVFSLVEVPSRAMRQELVSHSADTVAILSNTFTSNDPSGTRVGAGGNRTVRLRFIAAGKGHIVFQRKELDEPTADDPGLFRLDFDIHDGTGE